MAFDLLANPFALLDVCSRTPRQELAEAYQSAILDGEVDETALDKAFKALTSAKDRLRVEVDFLTAATPTEIRKILASAKAGTSLGSLAKTPLDRANLIAHELGNDPRPSLISDLAEALLAIDPIEVAQDINAARQVAKIAPASETDVTTAVTTAIAERAGEVASAIVGTPGRIAMAEALVDKNIQNPSARSFLEPFIAAYSKLTAPELRRLRGLIDEELQASRANPGRDNSSNILSLLKRWDAIRQPNQVWEEAHGLTSLNPKPSAMIFAAFAFGLRTRNRNMRRRLRSLAVFKRRLSNSQV